MSDWMDVPPQWRPGNVMSTGVLGRFGVGPTAIKRLTRSGELVRLRRGWFAAPGADEVVVRAVRSGGLLGCVSALTWHGAWKIDDRLHTYRTHWGKRVATAGCPAPKPQRAVPVPVVSPELALAQALRCASTENVLVLAESMIGRNIMSRSEVEQVLGPTAAALDHSDSGTETMLRLRLRALRIRVRPQVRIRGVGRVDLVVGDRLVIEVDSFRHHADAGTYHRDRYRDQRLVAMGYLVVRLTWEQVMFQWEEVEQLILRLVGLRQHRFTKRLVAARDG
ncbi:DUF559 domain-containing protein [Enemella sp. A6]|uniref:DUF559 domain-containing protein n=1 Tax=Enemella sp. A6 TaxID=3440152 RepID=UPI003EC0F83F